MLVTVNNISNSSWDWTRMVYRFMYVGYC